MLALLLACALSQTTVEFHVLPPGHDGQVQGVGRARYYLLDEYLKLAEGDSELVLLRAQVISLGDINSKLRLSLDEKDAVIVTLENDKQTLTRRLEDLEVKYQTCEHDLMEASSPTIWPYVVGIVGALAGATGLGIWLGTR